MSNGDERLHEYEMTSSEQTVRNSRPSSGTHSRSQPTSTTQQLEPKSLPPELSNTLEQIVGQLDVLTQVCSSTSSINDIVLLLF